MRRKPAQGKRGQVKIILLLILIVILKLIDEDDDEHEDDFTVNRNLVADAGFVKLASDAGTS